MEPRSQADEFQTLVVLDTETTGLKEPSVTELAMIAVPFSSLPQCERAQDILVTCFNPVETVDPGAAKITGLSNNILDKFKGFNPEAFNLADAFFERLSAPILVVAHNGFGYDYPVLKNEQWKCSVRNKVEVKTFLNRADVFLADSWIYFREEDMYEDNYRELSFMLVNIVFSSDSQLMKITSERSLQKSIFYVYMKGVRKAIFSRRFA